MEQRLTRLYTKVLPPGRASVQVGDKTYIRTAVYPVEPDHPITVNQRILTRSPGEDLTTLLHQTVADGCRAALEGMIPGAIQAAALGKPTVKCQAAIDKRLDPESALPGSSLSLGPGLEEICRHCNLSEGAGAPAHNTAPAVPISNPVAQSLRVRTEHLTWPEWPLEGLQRDAITGDTAPDIDERFSFAPNWPRQPSSTTRPLVSLLFGGGVFRGVFHMGVANALNELGVTPDLVAGSSVGSIIAAMIAQVLSLPTQAARHVQLARLSATFLCMDRLILTDRLADFVRRFTLRAAETNFSPRDLDLILRSYDYDQAAAHDERRRRVAAGVERLFYLSAFEQGTLAEAGGKGDTDRLRTALERGLQGFLDRSGIGRELLGAEPLALLIDNHVIGSLKSSSTPSANLFQAFLHAGVYFLATATNLTEGDLDILGSPYAPLNANLLYGLLASSAFPGVFRPRAAWEVFQSASTDDEYIDGGTIDNLPLDAVTRFMDRASRQHLIARRPDIGGRPVPHLLFTASLERDPSVLRHGASMQNRCIELWQRATTFTHNRKIEAYSQVQKDLRAIYDAGQSGWEPVDVHVVAVKPRWMCSTFGFHPMLGFRRRKQAQSIAHGCASTLIALSAESQDRPHWAKAWGVSEAAARVTPSTSGPPLPVRDKKRPGECWFRTGPDCPFSKKVLERLTQTAPQGGPTWIGPATIEEVNRIYELCGVAETHEPPVT